MAWEWVGHRNGRTDQRYDVDNCVFPAVTSIVNDTNFELILYVKFYLITFFFFFFLFCVLGRIYNIMCGVI